MRPLAIIPPLLLTTVLAAGCGSSGNPVTADRAVCHDALSNPDPSGATAAQIDADAAGASPALEHLVTNLDNADTAVQVQETAVPQNIGAAYEANQGALKAFNAITAWCQSHEYG